MIWLVFCGVLAGCARPWTPDSVTVSVTGVGARPSGIPQPHGAVSVSGTWFLTPTQVMMVPMPTTTTLPPWGR